MTYRVLDLFSGIGGFSLGLERTGGFKTVAFCEIEPFCRRVLAKHWPEVPCYDDVRTLTADRLRTDGIAVDVICGGFPCQDISCAGKQIGLAGARSGLWSQICRLAGEIRPLFIIVENVAALLSNGLDQVLGDLAAIGYDAEWHCIPASALGAPHRRDRFWCVAWDADSLRQSQNRTVRKGTPTQSCGSCDAMADANGSGGSRLPWGTPAQIALIGGSGGDVADTAGIGRFSVVPSVAGREESEGAASAAADCGVARGREWWGTEPDVGRVAHGVPARVDRLRALGNAVVPQIPELIGRAILASEARP